MEPRRRFRFLKQLSEGTFGRVYMAEMVTDNNFSSVVAIKLLHGKWLDHEEIVQRSRDEARVLGLLHHRNIIRVESLTSINGQCAVIMEYLDGVDGKTLINHCAEANIRIPYKVIFEMMSACVSALEAAYYREPLRGGEPLQLIHRDIKPSNIMITCEGDIKVLDFGTAQARFEDREAATQALAFGSQAYMAPERLLGDPDAPSGDIFSVGVTLYELLARQSFGKIHRRENTFTEALLERVASLALDGLDEGSQEDVRALLLALLNYDAERRLDARQTLDILEELGEQVNDGSIRRFCREVITPLKGNMQSSSPDDPLAGSTLFEDVAQLDMDDAGEAEEEWSESAPTMAIGGDAARHSAVDLAPVEAKPPPPVVLDPGALDVRAQQQQPAPAPVTEQAAAPASEQGPEPASAVATKSNIADVIAEALASDTASAAASEPAASSPEDVVSAESSTSQPPTPSEPPPKPDQSIRRTVQPRSAEDVRHAPPSEQSKGGGGRLALLVVGLLLMLGVLGGGGYAAFVLLQPKPDTEETPVTGTTEVPEPTVPEGIDGQRIDVAELGEDNGTVVLRLEGGQASVKIDSTTVDFEQTWNGSGELELVGLSEGTYKTKIKSDSNTVRTTVDVVAGQRCVYTFNLSSEGEEEWAQECQ